MNSAFSKLVLYRRKSDTLTWLLLMFLKAANNAYTQLATNTDTIRWHGERRARNISRAQQHRLCLYTIGYVFLHDRPWISPWIKSISNESGITCHVVEAQLLGNCGVINNQLWRHQQNINKGSGKRRRCMGIAVFILNDLCVCRLRNQITHLLLWRTVHVFTRMLILCLFPSLLRNSGNKRQNDPLVSAQTSWPSSTCIILSLYIYIYIYC